MDTDVEFCRIDFALASGQFASRSLSFFSLKENQQEYKAAFRSLWTARWWELRNLFSLRVSLSTWPCRKMSDLLDDSSFMFTSESVGEGHPGELWHQL